MAPTIQENPSVPTAATPGAFPTTPILTTPTVLLRPYHASDVPSIVKEANDPLVPKYLRNHFPHPYTAADASDWVARTAASTPVVNFAVCHFPSGEYAGGIGLKPFPPADVEARTMEIGYWFGRAHWGRGLATEAVRAFSRWSFEAFPEVLRLEAGVFGGNAASGKVLEKAGYTLEGRRRNAGWKDGEAFDIVMYGLLREESLGTGAAVETP